MTTPHVNVGPGPARGLLVAAAINLVWINSSEVFRYFAFVMPMMRTAYPEVPNVAPMNARIFLSWAVWDLIVQAALMSFVWLYLEKFGYGLRNALASGALFWAAVFGVLWLALLNMNLATLQILSVALPLALAEALVGALIVDWALTKYSAAARAPKN